MKNPEEYLKEPYSIVLNWDEETKTFFAQILEFPGCFAEGTSSEEAVDRLKETAVSWIMSAQNLGQEIPEPFPFSGCNGKVALRMPKSLHQKAVMFAKREGVSLNQFIVSAISELVGAERIIERLTYKTLQSPLKVTLNIFPVDQKSTSAYANPLLSASSNNPYLGKSLREDH